MLDSQEYDIEFSGGEVTKLTANIITESMYVSCDDDGNTYILLDSLVDLRRSGNTLLLDDQNIVMRGRPALRLSMAG